MASATKEGPVTPEIPDVDAMLASTRAPMEEKMEELRPYADAFHKLEAIVGNFQAIADGTLRKPATRKRGTTATAERAPRGSRQQEFLAVIQQAGPDGITVAEAADKLDGINQNYLYRLARDLTEAGEVRKDGKKLIVAAA